MLRTGSRGPLAALLLSPLALLFLPGAPSAARRGTIRRVARLVLPAVLLLIVLLLIVLPGTERERLAATLLRVPLGEAGDAGERLLQDPSVAFRLEMARRSLGALADGLPWGWGTGAFPAVLFLRDFRLYPHNLEAELLIEQGLPGLLLLLVLLLVTLARARSLARTSTAGHWLLLLAFMALLNAQVSGDVTGNGELWFWSGMIGGFYVAGRGTA
jgi:O-antigen ligase